MSTIDTALRFVHVFLLWFWGQVSSLHIDSKAIAQELFNIFSKALNPLWHLSCVFLSSVTTSQARLSMPCSNCTKTKQLFSSAFKLQLLDPKNCIVIALYNIRSFLSFYLSFTIYVDHTKFKNFTSSALFPLEMAIIIFSTISISFTRCWTFLDVCCSSNSVMPWHHWHKKDTHHCCSFCHYDLMKSII